MNGGSFNLIQQVYHEYNLHIKKLGHCNVITATYSQILSYQNACRFMREYKKMYVSALFQCNFNVLNSLGQPLPGKNLGFGKVTQVATTEMV